MRWLADPPTLPTRPFLQVWPAGWMLQKEDRVADRWKTLADLGVGDRAMLPFQLVSKSASGATLAPITRNTVDGTIAQTGSMSISLPSAVIAGSFTIDPRVQPVYIQQLGLAVGDLLQDVDGVVTVARAVGLGPDGSLWSPYPDGHAAQAQDGFTVVGHVTLP